MKKALLKDSVKEIKNTYKRFISILLMAFLGVGFFAGIRASSPDMLDTIDQYFSQQNVYDIEVLSTLGLTQDDIDALRQLEGVKNVYGSYSTDAMIETQEKEVVAKVMAIDEVNQVELLEGKMPESNTECLVEENYLKSNDKKIGDSILLQIEEQEEGISLKEKQLTIVGTARSPLYISRERGTTTLGSGRIDYFMHVPKDNFDTDIFTQIYLILPTQEGVKTGSSAYEERVETVKEKIEFIKEERQQARYQSLVDTANAELTEAEQTFEQEKADAEKQLQEAQTEIDNGRKEIEEGKQTLENNRKKTNAQLNEAKKQIESAEKQIQENEKLLQTQEIQAQEGITQIEIAKKEQEKNLEQLETGIKQIEDNITKIDEQLKQESITEEQKQILQKQKEELTKKEKELSTQKKTLQTAISQMQTQIQSIQTQLESGKTQLAQARKTLQTSKSQYETSKTKAENEFAKAEKELEQAEKEIQEGEQTLAEKRQEFDTKIAEAEGELIDAREKIAEIEKPTWYILDRNSNSGYSSFIKDTENVENLGRVFPIVFFVIATLISLTSMTRMVEEQRIQIGTMKALGYNKFQIASKYILYASLACILGGVLGMSVGFYLLPNIIWSMYSMMYTITNFVITYNWYYAITGLGIASICIIGATALTTVQTLKQTPSELMRPKAPKPGKRVLLEKIPFLWKRFNFSQKVTLRNIFRYKKRFFMTIIGIAGCTALILTGFGIKDAISALLPDQYENIFHYQMQVSLKSALTQEQVNDLIQKVKQKEGITEVIQTYMAGGTIIRDDLQEEIQMIVPDNQEELKKVIALKNVKTKEEIELPENKILITDKVAELIGAKAGDTIILRNSEDEEVSVEVAQVVENYISHYVYITKQTYENLYGTFETNVLLLQYQNLDEEQEKALSKELLAENEVSTTMFVSSIQSMMEDMMFSLNYVVIVLIVSAGLLAFVVLYNLANVNISERIRELATIKVLGFYDREVYHYVSRETIILTIIGIVLGLVGGYFLSYFIMGTCEIDMLRFSKDILPLSYVYATLITIAFTIIVNIVTYFALKKVDMIESLKSIE